MKMLVYNFDDGTRIVSEFIGTEDLMNLTLEHGKVYVSFAKDKNESERKES